MVFYEHELKKKSCSVLWYSVPWEKHRLMVSKMFLHILFYLILPTVFEGNTIGTDVENEA